MKPCPKCGGPLTRPATNPKATPRCRVCRSAYEKARYPSKDKEWARELARKWRAANRERLRKTAAQWRETHREIARLGSWRSHGIAVAPGQFEQMLASQNGRCGICGTSTPGGRWSRFHVDHDHQYGHVRGLLCTRCNTGLARFDDSPRLLRAAAKYLETHQPKLAIAGKA